MGPALSIAFINMPDTWEVVVIAIAAIVIIGPERLPEVSRSMGRALGKLRSVRDGFRDEMKAAAKESGLDEVRSTMREEYEKAKSGADEVTATMDDVNTSLTTGPRLDGHTTRATNSAAPAGAATPNESGEESGEPVSSEEPMPGSGPSGAEER